MQLSDEEFAPHLFRCRVNTPSRIDRLMLLASQPEPRIVSST